MALSTAIIGAVYGVALCSRVAKRQWWKVIAISAIGSCGILNMVTEGVHTRLENRAKFAATMILLACFVVAAVADARTRRRTG